MDAVVLQVVFTDMWSNDNSESPPELRGEPLRPIYVSKKACGGRVNANQILSRNDEKQWDGLTKTQLNAAAEAADDLIARTGRGDPLPGLSFANPRLKIYEDAGAATQPTRETPFVRERASCVYVPGYSKDGRYAVVHLIFPWSIHSGEVTYILERTDRGWKVVLRDFIYYV